MCEVVMQTVEPDSTREVTERLVEIIGSDYTKAYLKQVSDNETQIISEERLQLLSILGDLEDLFGGTLGYWDTYPVGLDLNTGSKLFNIKYYQVPRIY